MAYTTILNEKMSDGASPNCYYTVQYEETARTATTVTLAIKILAHLRYAASYHGYALSSTLTVGGQAFAIPIKGTETWSGTATHTITTSITVSASAGTTALSAYFAVTNPSTASSTLSKTACSNISISRKYTTASISSSGGVIGSDIAISLTGKYPSTANCDVTYKFGSKTGTIESATTATSVTWKTAAIKSDLLAQIPANTSGEGTLTCVTKDGSIIIGTHSCPLYLSTSEKVSISSVSLSPVNSNAFLAAKGLYVAGYTKARVVTNAVPGLGSSISSYSITGLGATGSTADWTSPVLSGTEKKTVTITVTDRRSSTQVTRDITSVLSYSKPTLSLNVQRGTYSAGTWSAGDSGKNIKIAVNVGLGLIANGNRGTLALELDGATIATYSELSGGAKEHIIAEEIDDNEIHVITAVVTDSLGEKSPEATFELPTARVNMSMLPEDKGVTFGGHPVIEGLVSEFPAKFNNGVSLDLEKAGFSASIASACSKDGDGFASLHQLLLNFVHPVGSYYWSSSASNPGTLFGGNWTQITDRFVLAAGSSYSVNGTGGAATVALSTAHMPSHAHSVSGTAASAGSHDHAIRYKAVASGSGSWITLRRWDSEDSYTGTNRATSSDGAHTHSVSGTAAAVGSGTAHENMPPYIVAYCWRRTS